MDWKSTFSMCRLCLSYDEVLINIYENESEDSFEVKESLEDLLRVEVMAESELPWIVCQSCIGSLRDFSDFKYKCLNSNDAFIQRYTTPHPTESKFCDRSEAKEVDAKDDVPRDYLTLPHSVVKVEMDWKEGTEEIDFNEEDMGNDMSASADQLSPINDQEMKSKYDRNEKPCSNPSSPDMENDVKLFAVGPDAVDTNLSNESDKERSLTSERTEVYPKFPQITVRKIDDIMDSSQFSRGSVEDLPQHFMAQAVDEDQSLRKTCDKVGVEIRNIIVPINIGEELLQLPDRMGLSKDQAETFDEKNVVYQFNTGVKCYSCRMCGKSFTCERSLQSHESIHLAKRPVMVYECNECPKSFFNSFHLQDHMRGHTNVKSYACDLCPKFYSRKNDLLRHMRVHTGDRPFQCKACSLSFTRVDALRAHMKIHIGEKPYPCTVCSKSFARRDYLQKHMHVHTGERPYKCDMCGKSFSQMSNYRTHMRTHTGGPPF